MFTNYKHRGQNGELAEWRELTKYYKENYRSTAPVRGPAGSTALTRKLISVPRHFARNRGCNQTCAAGRLFLECYLGRVLESHEVCRHGVLGPNDHSYTNIQVGDAVSNMIDDLETGKVLTSKTMLIENINRLQRLLANRIHA